MASKTKAQTFNSLSCSPTSMKFTAKWSKGETYTDQEIRYYITKDAGGKSYHEYKGSSSSNKLSKGDTKHSIDLNEDKYCPNGDTKVTKVQVKLRAKAKNKSWCSWVSKTLTLAKPNKPTYEAPVFHDTNLITFSWQRSKSDKEKNYLTRYYWQSVILENPPTANGNNLDSSYWADAKTQEITYYNPSSPDVRVHKEKSIGTMTPSYTSITIVEDTSKINSGKRYVRFFRVREEGPAGKSDYRCSSKSYGPAGKSDEDGNYSTSEPTVETLNSDGTAGTLSAASFSSRLDPTDSYSFEYAIVVPDAESTIEDNTFRTTLSCPTNGVEWKQDASIIPETGSDSVVWRYNLEETIGYNQALYWRLIATHDNFRTISDPLFTGCGPLSKPTGLSVSAIDTTTHRATVAATNNSSIGTSFLAVYYRTSSDMSDQGPIGIIPNGESSITVQAPDWGTDSISFGVKCFVADYSPVTASSNDVTIYEIENVQMESKGILWQGGAIALPPTNVNLSKHSDGKLLVTWDWSWSEANSAEISWADSEDAWESTDAPSSYTITNVHAGRWIISGLEAGEWYVRVRLIKVTGNDAVYGTYSDTASFNLSSAPQTPYLTLEPEIVGVDNEVICSWQYTSTDGTAQAQAELAEAVYDEDNEKWSYTPLAGAITNTSKQIVFSPSTYGWARGSTHYLSVRVMSASNQKSKGWSSPVKLGIADPPVAEIHDLSMAVRSYYISNDNPDPENVETHLTLYEMPITLTVTGAGIGGTTSVYIERAEQFTQDRPDGKDFQGYEGEIVYESTVQNVEDDAISFTIDNKDITGHLDDEAHYRIVAQVKDSFGQTDKTGYDFYVHWDRQAQLPACIVDVDHDSDVIYITAIAPAPNETDTCDIYRLSVDSPQLIIEDGQFNTKYVDPYPTLGKFGGYRVVFKTKNGDYKTEDGLLAWRDCSYSASANDLDFHIVNGEVIVTYPEDKGTDVPNSMKLTLETGGDLLYEYDNTITPVDFSLGNGELYVSDLNYYDYIDTFGIVIDFNKERLFLPGNVSLQSKWAKSFQVTEYLGGSIEGDWNPAVQRTGSLTATIPVEHDPDAVRQLRKLAEYSGICHVRTPEGSNFYANIDVNDSREEKWVNKISKVTLDITKVDAVSLDGIEYANWIEGE